MDFGVSMAPGERFSQRIELYSDNKLYIASKLRKETDVDLRVTVLRCHTNRTKRVATENSPFLFLTVSEDGTVRQHDLRRPHHCREECPEPLFYAPRGVDLYSLSVSTVAPHIFAVAGRTDCVGSLQCQLRGNR